MAVGVRGKVWGDLSKLCELLHERIGTVEVLEIFHRLLDDGAPLDSCHRGFIKPMMP